MVVHRYENYKNLEEINQKYPLGQWSEGFKTAKLKSSEEGKYYVARREKDLSWRARAFYFTIGVIWSARKLFIPLFDPKFRKYWFAAKVIHKCSSTRITDTIIFRRLDFSAFCAKYGREWMNDCNEEQRKIAQEKLKAEIPKTIGLLYFRKDYKADYEGLRLDVKAKEEEIIEKELKGYSVPLSFNGLILDNGLENLITTAESKQILKNRFGEMALAPMRCEAYSSYREVLDIGEAEIRDFIEKQSEKLGLGPFYEKNGDAGYQMLSAAAKALYQEEYAQAALSNNKSDLVTKCRDLMPKELLQSIDDALKEFNDQKESATNLANDVVKALYKQLNEKQKDIQTEHSLTDEQEEIGNEYNAKQAEIEKSEQSEKVEAEKQAEVQREIDLLNEQAIQLNCYGNQENQKQVAALVSHILNLQKNVAQMVQENADRIDANAQLCLERDMLLGELVISDSSDPVSAPKEPNVLERWKSFKEASVKLDNENRASVEDVKKERADKIAQAQSNLDAKRDVIIKGIKDSVPSASLN